MGRVQATSGFYLVLALANFLDGQGMVLPALLACTLHELGHYAMIRVSGGEVRGIRLTAVGAEMIVRQGLSYGAEIAAALSGPCVNLLLAAIFCRVENGAFFAGINLALALFNLMPVGRLDGGRALYCLLAAISDDALADRVSYFVDGVFTWIIFLCGGVFFSVGGSFTLLLVGSWLLLGMKSVEKPVKKACYLG